MEVDQSEFRIIDTLFEKLPVCFLPDAFLYRSVLDELHISNQRHAIPAEEIANAGLGIDFEMGSFSIKGRAFRGYEIYV